MSNHTSSQNPLELLGNSMGPVDGLFEHWLDQQGDNIDRTNLNQMMWMKYIYFTAVCDLYNMLMTVIKGDHTLDSLAIVSEAVRLNINNYMQSLPTPTVN